MHDKFGNEVKVGDEVRFMGGAVAPGLDGKWHQVERQGVVARTSTESTTCNVEVLTVVPNARFLSDPEGGRATLDPSRPVVAVPQLALCTAKESRVVASIDGRALLESTFQGEPVEASPTI